MGCALTVRMRTILAPGGPVADRRGPNGIGPPDPARSKPKPKTAYFLITQNRHQNRHRTEE
jgi:hypothetical protein